LEFEIRDSVGHVATQHVEIDLDVNAPRVAKGTTVVVNPRKKLSVTLKALLVTVQADGDK
jgi:hypothetical protein